MFRTIRWRLVAWTMLVLALILLALGGAVYAALARTLISQVDRNLASRSEQAGPTFEGLARGGPPEREGYREGYRGGVFYLVVDGNGRVVANPQRVNVAGVQLPTPPLRGGMHASVSLDGDATRVFVRSLGPRAPEGAMLVVGQSLAAEEGALDSLLMVLVIGGGGGLLLSLVGAWFLAGRALVPIEQAFRRQQEFVADASHELRTPLTVLQSATDLLNRHRAEPLEQNHELFDDIRHELARLERLASDLLTLARSDRGELDLAVAPFDLRALSADVARKIEPLALARGIELRYEQGGDVLDVEADPDRIQQVLLALLDNALKHTPAGGRVTVRPRRQGPSALVEIEDTGSGIAPEHLPRVFDRFYRAESARSRVDGGSGLGLAISRMLAQAHGGDLSLTSTPGVGTRVVLRLPLSPEQRHLKPSAADTPVVRSELPPPSIERSPAPEPRDSGAAPTR